MICGSSNNGDVICVRLFLGEEARRLVRTAIPGCTGDRAGRSGPAGPGRSPQKSHLCHIARFRMAEGCAGVTHGVPIPDESRALDKL